MTLHELEAKADSWDLDLESLAVELQDTMRATSVREWPQDVRYCLTGGSLEAHHCIAVFEELPSACASLP
jgi:hypothetical protein